MNTTREFISVLTEKISLPDIYRQIRVLMDNPNVKIEDFDELIRADAQLGGSIIRIANSAFFGFDRKVDVLYDAISLIGVGQLHDLLLGSLCMRTFANVHWQATDYINDFWRQSIRRGIAARNVSRFCRMPPSNQYFALGFLLGIGHAAMFVAAPKLAIKSFQESQQKQCPVDIIERANFGFDYCRLGADLLRHWHLPQFYPQVIQHHLCPERALPSIRKETEIAYLAHIFCNPPRTEGHRRTGLLDKHQELLVKQKVNQEIIDHENEIFAMLSPSK